MSWCQVHHWSQITYLLFILLSCTNLQLLQSTTSALFTYWKFLLFFSLTQWLSCTHLYLLQSTTSLLFQYWHSKVKLLFHLPPVSFIIHIFCLSNDFHSFSHHDHSFTPQLWVVYLRPIQIAHRTMCVHNCICPHDTVHTYIRLTRWLCRTIRMRMDYCGQLWQKYATVHAIKGWGIVWCHAHYEHGNTFSRVQLLWSLDTCGTIGTTHCLNGHQLSHSVKWKKPFVATLFYGTSSNQPGMITFSDQYRPRKGADTLSGRLNYTKFLEVIGALRVCSGCQIRCLSP